MILYTSITWCKVPFSMLSPACPSLPPSCCIFLIISTVLWNFFQAICSMLNSTAPSIHPCRTFLVSPPQEPHWKSIFPYPLLLIFLRICHAQERLFMLYAILLNFQSLWQGTSSKGFQKSKKTSLTFIHMLVDSLTLKQEFPLELQSRTQQNCTLHPFFWKREGRKLIFICLLPWCISFRFFLMSMSLPSSYYQYLTFLKINNSITSTCSH